MRSKSSAYPLDLASSDCRVESCQEGISSRPGWAEGMNNSLNAHIGMSVVNLDENVEFISFIFFSFWVGLLVIKKMLPKRVLEMNMRLCFLCVCMLELVDEGACLSDSTSEEHSLSSYTSESFDDNGKTLMLTHTFALFLLVHTVRPLNVIQKKRSRHCFTFRSHMGWEPLL